MPLHPMAWHTPPEFRQFPDEIQDVYEDADSALQEVCELWTWKHDLVTYSGIGPRLDGRKIANQLADEARAFMVGTGEEGQEA